VTAKRAPGNGLLAAPGPSIALMPDRAAISRYKWFCEDRYCF
jgi:hypothetical protein